MLNMLWLSIINTVKDKPASINPPRRKKIENSLYRLSQLDNDVPALVIGEGDFSAAAGRHGERGCLVADLQFEFNFFCHKFLPADYAVAANWK